MPQGQPHAAERAPGPHAATSRVVPAGGCRWHVQRMGEGPALWLLHGTGASCHSWRDLMPLLASSFTVVVPDLPGHGRSGRLPPGRQSIAAMAEALAALADALHLPPLALVGHSAGAALAVRAVLDERLAPAQLVGINAALMPFGGLAGRLFGPMARMLALQPLVPWLFAWGARDPTALQRLVASTGSTLDPEGVALYARLLRNPAHVAGALAMMTDWDLDTLWRDLPQLAVPLALMVGDRDGTVPPLQAQRVREHRPGTKLIKLPGLGHLAHEEAPRLVVKRLRTLLHPVLPAGALPATDSTIA